MDRRVKKWNDPSWRRVNLRLSDEVHHALHLIAAEKRLTLQEIIEKLVAEYVESVKT